MFNVLCRLYNIECVCTMYSVRLTVFSVNVQHTVYIIHFICSVYSVVCTVFSVNELIVHCRVQTIL